MNTASYPCNMIKCQCKQAVKPLLHKCFTYDSSDENSSKGDQTHCKTLLSPMDSEETDVPGDTKNKSLNLKRKDLSIVELFF